MLVVKIKKPKDALSTEDWLRDVAEQEGVNADALLNEYEAFVVDESEASAAFLALNTFGCIQVEFEE